MPVFMDTGGGDIYAAETKEECLAAIRKDSENFKDYPESDVFEVPGDTAMRIEGERSEIFSTLEKQYTNLGYGYCIASENC